MVQPLIIGEEWQTEYSHDRYKFENTIEELWKDINPFYELLHGYTRHKLSIRYGSGQRIQIAVLINIHVTENQSGFNRR